MAALRWGVIGTGNMGMVHARTLYGGTIHGAELAAVCDIRSDRRSQAETLFGSDVKIFDTTDALFESGSVDAVLIAAPHYDHPPLAVKAFSHGLHVLIEKPAGVYTKQVREMNEAATESGKTFGIMYNQRTNPVYGKLRELIRSGELGEIIRTVWIITNWFRTQAYYDSGSWRATWAGEGGGVLLNQDPHQLDIWQWTCGMPVRVRAFCGFGKHHDIEVEDDVTAYVEYGNGATGLFVTSTGEAPGTDRFEISGDRGKVVIENGTLEFRRLRESSRTVIRESEEGFAQPECWRCEIPVTGSGTSHAGIMADFTNAVLNGTPLLAPGEEGIRGLELSNAMHLSAWTDSWVNLPIDEDLFLSELRKKIAGSRFRKTVKEKFFDPGSTPRP